MKKERHLQFLNLQMTLWLLLHEKYGIRSSMLLTNIIGARCGTINCSAAIISMSLKNAFAFFLTALRLQAGTTNCYVDARYLGRDGVFMNINEMNNFFVNMKNLSSKMNELKTKTPGTMNVAEIMNRHHQHNPSKPRFWRIRHRRFDDSQIL